MPLSPDLRDFTYYCDSFRFSALFTVYFFGKGSAAGVQAGQADRQNRDSRRTRELEAEVRALRKQLAEKDEVIDVLKKSVGILSRP